MPPTIPPRLEVGRTVKVIEWFEYVHPLTGVAWSINVGDRLVLMKRRGCDWRVRCGGLTFNVSAAWLAKHTGGRE